MWWAYLAINAATLAGPLARSFEPRIAYWRRWHALLPALALTLAFFIVWDAVFTAWGVWGFNDDYLVGCRMWGLPVEEWLFFVTVPYACLFIYEVLNHFVRRDWLGNAARWVGWGLAAIGVAVVAGHWGRLYTCSAFGLMVLLLLVHTVPRPKPWLGRFLLAYGVSLLPFFLVNGVLTGGVTESPIVWYDDAHNLGIRLWTIPADDLAYGLDLMLMNVGYYEWFKRRAARPSATPAP